MQQINIHKFKEIYMNNDDVHYDGTPHGLTNITLFAS
jgi:hypothetical protein